MKMKNKVKYGVFSILIFIAVIVAVQFSNAWMLINPGAHFDYNWTHKEFRVYSDKPEIPEFRIILDDVSNRLEGILGYDFNKRYDIFLCNSPDFYEKFANKIGKPEKTQGFNLQPLGYTFVNLSFISKMREEGKNKFQHSILEGNPGHILAHEICHQLISEKIGFLKSRKTATWKLEGYCEYAASTLSKREDKNYRFSDEVRKFISGYYSGISPGRKYYIKSLLMTEYFLDIKGKSFDELMNEEISEDELFKEVQQTNSKENQ